MKRSKTRHNILELVMIAYAAIGVICIVIALLVYFAKNSSAGTETTGFSEITTEDDGFTDAASADADTADSTEDTDTAQDEGAEASSDATGTDTAELTEEEIAAEELAAADEAALEEAEEASDQVLEDAQDFLEENTDINEADLDEEVASETTEAQGTFTVDPSLSRNVTVRSEPDVNSARLGSVAPGASGTVVQEGDEWTLVEVNGLTGYMRNDLIIIDSGN